MPPALLFYAIPFFVLLLSLEAWFSYRENRYLYETKDTFTSLGLGIGNVVAGLVTKTAIFGLFSLLYQYRLLDLDYTVWWYWVLLFCRRLILLLVPPYLAWGELVLGFPRSAPLFATL